jgi:hypothetical protein
MLHHALEKEIRTLFEITPTPFGAALTDLDGSDLVVHPKHMAEQLRVQAIYTGLMLKRLLKLNTSGAAEDLDRIKLEGKEGTLLAIRVGIQHQLVLMLDPEAYPLRYETRIDDVSAAVDDILKRSIL